jgi:transposase
MESQVLPRKAYPTDVSDDEWAFAAPYLTLMSEDAPQRHHDLREVFNALRWIVHTGAPWRYLPGDLPPWPAVSQQTRRWLDAGVFAAMAHDLREVLRWAEGRAATPTAAIFDSATRQSTPESGHRAGYDGHKQRQGSKIHLAVDTLGHLLALLLTPADAGDREQVAALAEAVQDATGSTVELAEAKRGFVLLPHRWVVERSFAWAARFRRLAKDYERLPDVVAGLHFLAFTTLMLHRLVTTAAQSP